MRTLTSQKKKQRLNQINKPQLSVSKTSVKSRTIQNLSLIYHQQDWWREMKPQWRVFQSQRVRTILFPKTLEWSPMKKERSSMMNTLFHRSLSMELKSTRMRTLRQKVLWKMLQKSMQPLELRSGHPIHWSKKAREMAPLLKTVLPLSLIKICSVKQRMKLVKTSPWWRKILERAN